MLLIDDYINTICTPTFFYSYEFATFKVQTFNARAHFFKNWHHHCIFPGSFFHIWQFFFGILLIVHCMQCFSKKTNPVQINVTVIPVYENNRRHQVYFCQPYNTPLIARQPARGQHATACAPLIVIITPSFFVRTSSRRGLRSSAIRLAICMQSLIVLSKGR